MSHALLLMLENIDRRKNEIVPIDSTLDPETLQDHHKQLMVRTAGIFKGTLKTNKTKQNKKNQKKTFACS